MSKRTNRKRDLLIFELRMLAQEMWRREQAGWSILDRAVVELARLYAGQTDDRRD